MTNSEKQTKEGAAEGDLPAYASGDFWARWIVARPSLFVGGVLLLIGWGFILDINRWHVTVPVVVLWMGWLGVLATVRFLWSAGVAIASETEGQQLKGQQQDELALSEALRNELIAEKKSLLQAIKEIEFDRDLGKMSEADAVELMRFYRTRAIEVIKELDGQSETSLTVRQRIDRDLEARLAVEVRTKVSTEKKLAKTKKAKTKKAETKKAKTKAAEKEQEDHRLAAESKTAAKEVDGDDDSERQREAESAPETGAARDAEGDSVTPMESA